MHPPLVPAVLEERVKERAKPIQDLSTTMECNGRKIQETPALIALGEGCNADAQVEAIQALTTVATELVESEARPKHVAVLSIRQEQWKLDAIRLQTVRPFLCKEIVLSEFEEEWALTDEERLMDFLAVQVDELLEERNQADGHAATLVTDDP